MRRRQIDTTVERRLVTGMIVSTHFLRDIRSIYATDLVETDFTRTVASWCLDYYEQHQQAPGRQIQDLFHNWYRVTKDDTQADLIEEFLASLSDEHDHADHYNAEYHLRQAERYFKEKSLKNLADDIQAYLSQGQVEEAEKLRTEYERIERPQSNGVDPFDSPDTFQRAFEARQEPLFQIPGALGQMMNPQFVRQSFIGILGPEKRGKSWWLMDLAMQAWRQRCNVAFFQAGDMSEEQFVRRQGIYVCRRSDDPRYCGELLVPVLDCHNNQQDLCGNRNRASKQGCFEAGLQLDYETATRDGYKPCRNCQREDKQSFRPVVWHEPRPRVEPITWRDAYRTGVQIKKRNRARGFRLATYPNSTLTVAEMGRVLTRWYEEDGFVPDVIVDDYSDIFAPEDNRAEFRHQQNGTWKAKRRLSQVWNACYITATQADAASYEQKSLGLKNFSEDKRKYAHVTAMYALNQTKDEKKRGIMRIGELLVREDAGAGYQVTVLQCLEMGRPHLASFIDIKPKQEEQ